MTATNETLSMATEAQLKRDLPQSIVVPPIRGEMVHLRPATVEDLPRLDELDAFYGASKITGKDAVTERAIVHTWVFHLEVAGAGISTLLSRITAAVILVWVIRNPAAPSHGPY